MAYFEEVARQFQLSGQELTHLFWRNAILPDMGGYIGKGFDSNLFLWIYDRLAIRKIQARL